MEEWHPLLDRQCRRYLAAERDNPSLAGFLRAVDSAYRSFDVERSQLERFLDAASTELASCNEEMRTVFQLFPDLFFRLDGEGRILDYTLGMGSGPTLVRQTDRMERVEDVVSGEAGEKLLKAWRQARRQEGVATVEFDTMVRQTHLFYEAIFIPRGEQCLLFLRDIGSRRMAEDLLRCQNESLRVLHDAGMALMERRTLRDLCEVLVRRAAALLEVEDAYLRLYDPSTGQWNLAFALGEVARFCDPSVTQLWGISLEVSRSKSVFYLSDYDAWEGRNLKIPPGTYGSVLGSHIMSSGETKGILCLLGKPGKALGAEQTFLLEQFVRTAALAIENVRLGEEVREELEERRRVEQEVRHLNATLEERVSERTAQIADMNRELEEEISEKVAVEQLLEENLTRVRAALEETVNALTATTEKRDPFTAGHQRMVAHLACAIAQRLGMSPDRIEVLRTAGLLHDIGKISVPIEILSKPGRLTAEEMRLIHPHSTVGYEILARIPFDGPVAEMVWQHHERLDGSGYPRGLRGEEILLEARILAVADVVEAMASHRPYRPSLGIRAALQEVVRHRGTAFDPPVVDACVEIFREGYRLRPPE